MIDKLPDLLDVDVYEFEELIHEFVKNMGFSIEESGRTPNGILDILAKTTNPMGGKIISLVRAAPFERNVDVKKVEDLHNTMQEKGAVRAAFITTSDFTPEAREYARGKSISLINKFKLIESLDEQGIKIEPAMYKLLEKHGLTERRFGGERHVFVLGKNMKQTIKYFNDRRKKKFLGLFGREEEISNITLKHSPVSIFRVVYEKGASTEATSLAKTEQEDYIYVNLNTADLYYVRRGRGVGGTKKILESTDVLQKIEGLPSEAKQHLIDLLEHGELPHKHLDDKHLSILESKNVINVFDAGKTRLGGSVSSLAHLATMAAQEIADVISVVIHELVTFESQEVDEREGVLAEAKETEELKSVRAEIRMPHMYGGEYDLKKFIAMEKDAKTKFEEDTVKYSSGMIADLLTSILSASVESQGVIFMSHYTCTFMDKETKALTRREKLITPKFLEEKRKVKKREEQPKEEFGVPYKIIR